MMYNEEQKRRFINNIDLDKYAPNYWQVLFTKTAERERKIGKDLCDFSAHDIAGCLKLFNSSSFDTLYNTKGNISEYVDWCITETLSNDGQNHCNELTDEIINRCVSRVRVLKKIISKENLLNIIGNIDNDMDKFLLMAIWEGIELEEIPNIVISDIDFDTKKVDLSTRRISVSDVFLEICLLADSQEIYKKNNGRIINFIPAKTVYKDKKGSKPGNMPQKIGRILRGLDTSEYELCSQSLKDSGEIHMINTLAEENNYTAEQVLYDDKLFNEVSKKYGMTLNVRRRFLMKYNDFLK